MDTAAINTVAVDTAAMDTAAKEVITLEAAAPVVLQLRPPPTDLNEAFARFLMVDVANGNATPDTVKAYHREVKYFVAWCNGQGIDPVAVQRTHIEEYREWLKGKGLAPITRSHKLSTISRFYDAAVKHGLLQHNPVLGVKGGKDLTSEVEKLKALTEAALTTLAAAIPA